MVNRKTYNRVMAAEDHALVKVGAVAALVVRSRGGDPMWHETFLDQLEEAVRELEAARDGMRAALR